MSEPRSNGYDKIGKGHDAAYYHNLAAISHADETPFIWKFFKVFFITLLVLTFVAAMGLLVLFNSLKAKPIHVKGLIPYIEQAINTQLNDVHVNLKSVILKRDEKLAGVQIRLLGMQILQNDGKLVAETPEAGFNFDIQALLRGEALAEEITFYEPQLALLYDEEGGLSLSFAGQGISREKTQKSKRKINDFRGGIGQGDSIAGDQAVVKKLASVFTSLKKYRKATSTLKKIRVSDAQLYFSQGGINSTWTIPSFMVDLTQTSKKSDIIGRFSVVTNKRPMDVDFKIIQDVEEDSLELTISNFKPSYFFPKIGYFGSVGLMHVPVSALTTIRLSKTGILNSVDAIVKLQEGMVFFPGDKLAALKVRDSTIRVHYKNDAEEKITIEPSVLRWDGNEAVIRGHFAPLVKEDGWEKGRFFLLSDNIRLNASLFKLPPQNVGEWIAKGTFDLKQHYIQLADFFYKFQQAEIRMTGDIYRTNKVPDIKLNGKLNNISLKLLKRIWNNKVAPETLGWIGNNLVKAQIAKGQFNIDIPHTAYDYLNVHKVMPEKSLDLKLITTNILGRYSPDLPPFFTSQANVHLTGQYFSLFAPEVRSHLPSAEEIKLSNFKFQVDQTQIGADVEYGLYEFDISARNAALIEYLGLPALGVLNSVKYKANSFKGKAKGHLKLKIPFKDNMKAEDIAVKGHLTLKKLARKKLFGNVSLTNGDVKLKISPEAIQAQGKIFLNKVPARLTWQHIFKASPDKQPPLRLITTLTKKHQKRLGIDTGKILVGSIPVEVMLERMDKKNPIVKVHADITNAEFNLPSLFWKKLPGSPAQVEFEIKQRKRKGIHLKNVTLYGEDLGIEGDVYLDKKDRFDSFNFRRFTLNLLTNMKVSGKMRRSDNVLMVEAKGRSFDARPFFEAVFAKDKKGAAAKLKQTKKKESAFYGVNIKAQINTLIGFHEETATNVSVNMKKRGTRLLSLISRATLHQGAPIAVNLVVGEKNQRFLVSETTNTGSALKLIGFYSKMHGGQGSLQVNLDAPGQADETGRLWLKNFVIANDDVMLKVLKNNKNRLVSTQDQIRSPNGQQALSLNFDNLTAHFSFGNGQMLLHESSVNGPLLGATLRGKVDFKTSHIALGGTYVPLFGLNSSLKAVPILGDIVVGRNGEGVFGITYAIQGKMKNPTVLVNPLSLITPGIFRQIMEFQSPNMQTFSPINPQPAKTNTGRKKRRSRTH